MPTRDLVLMNKDRAVTGFEYDFGTHSVLRVTDGYQTEYAPFGAMDMKGHITRATLNSWWSRRAIPASRRHIQDILQRLRLSSPIELAERSYGLSLSDCYWVNDIDHPQKWKDINFFENDFSEDLGLITTGQVSPTDPDLFSPSGTLNGNLQKKWTIVNGERILMKGGSGSALEEIYNEKIASDLHTLLLDPEDFVPYTLVVRDRRTYCACGNMVKYGEEFIPAWDIIRHWRHPNDQNDYQFLLSCYDRLGVKGAASALEKMFVCDFILAGDDRHWNNFGLIRSADDPGTVRLAPIFDSGGCLWHTAERLDLPSDYAYRAKPFGGNGMVPTKQLRLFKDLSWLDFSKLRGFAEGAGEVMGRNESLSEKRIRAVVRGIEHNIDIVRKYAEELAAERLRRKAPVGRTGAGQ